MGFFNVTMEWDVSLDKDFHEEGVKISQALVPALRGVGAEMEAKLEKRIEEDVYEAYTPILYPRRKDHPAFGRALSDKRNVTIEAYTRKSFDVGGLYGAALYFIYDPPGENSGTFGDVPEIVSAYIKKKQSKQENSGDGSKKKGKKKKKAMGFDPDTPVKECPLSGNALIRRIEKGQEAYDWKRNDEPIPPRKFWSNFLLLCERTDFIMDTLISSMPAYKITKDGVGMDVVFDASDGALD